MPKTFSGKTEDAQSVFLGAGWWQEGKTIAGRVMRKFVIPAGNGSDREQTCYAIALDKGVVVDGETQSQIALGDLAGLRMALQASGLSELLPDDAINLRCTGFTDTDKGNARANFQIHVIRPDRESARA